MSDIVSNIQIVLQNSNYRTWLAPGDGTPVVCFEDEAAMGFVFTFDSAKSLIDTWQAKELTILMKHAPNFQRGGDKVWNIYSVFLCTVGATEREMRKVRQIEEDLDRTRKIASCGLTALEDVIQALLPLISIQYAPRLDDEDSSDRLRKRIATIAPQVAGAIFQDGVPPEEIVRLLGENL